MIRQYFTELKLDNGTSLSEGLQELVNEAETELNSEYIEVVQVVKHDRVQYTVILNVDSEQEEEDEA